MVRTMSVSIFWVSSLEKILPNTGISLNPGIPESDLRSSNLIRPASRLVSPSFNLIFDSIIRLVKVGCPSSISARIDSIFTKSARVISLLWCTRGVKSI